MGRHALALAGLGYRVTGIDLSDALLEKAKEHDKEGLIERLVQGDMRSSAVRRRSVRSNGQFIYFLRIFFGRGRQPRVLREIRRVLKKDGRFSIDFLNPTYIEANLVPRSERTDEASGLHIEEIRTIENGWVIKKINIGPLSSHQESAAMRSM